MPVKSSRTAVTFIVRIARAPRGQLQGTVERVRTGEKQRFAGADGIGGVIERMLVRDDEDEGRR